MVSTAASRKLAAVYTMRHCEELLRIYPAGCTRLFLISQKLPVTNSRRKGRR